MADFFGWNSLERMIERVDALLRPRAALFQRRSRIDEVIGHEPRIPVRRPAVDAEALEALARELERAVMARLGPEVDRVIQEKLSRVLSGLVGKSVEGVRYALTQSVTQMVREAVERIDRDVVDAKRQLELG